MTSDPLILAIESQLSTLPDGPLVVAFSGGLDSTVLLHALASSTAARARGVRAIHVDHRLQPASADWAQHCRHTADALGIACDVHTVFVECDVGDGLEAAARSARMAVFERALAGGGIVALAHHRDDQTETVLLKLLRGAGVDGLRGMRTLRRCGDGWLWRPLLQQRRSALQAYASARSLAFIDDPSNTDRRHARNFLRHDVLPSLRERWPNADVAIGHSARWLAAAAEYLEQQTRAALAQLQGVDPATLRWRGWLALPDALRGPVLREWLRRLDLAAPEHFHLDELERQLRDAAEDRLPCVDWRGTQVRRYRDLIYAMHAADDPPADWQMRWDGAAAALPSRCGIIELVSNATSRPVRLDDPVDVRFRRGGEALRPEGSPHTRALRDLYQHAGVPPWERDRIPLLFDGTVLLAVGDLWRTDAWAQRLAAVDAQLRWTPTA